MSETPAFDWYYGPTATDPDPAKMWCRHCGSEVYLFDDAYVCFCQQVEI